MSEDGVRAEKCKKYQVTALGTAAWGLRGSHVRCCSSLFVPGLFCHFFSFSPSRLRHFSFVGGGVVLREQFRCVSMTKTWST